MYTRISREDVVFKTTIVITIPAHVSRAVSLKYKLRFVVVI